MHFQSILLWRPAQVPTSIHLSRQYSKALHISMFGPRLFHMDNRHHSRHLWQHPQQLICLGQVLHVQKVLQQSTCQHHLRLRRCLHSASAVVQEPYVTENGKIRKVRSVTDIDWKYPLPMSSLNPTSREALDQLHHRQNCVCFDHRFPS